MEKSVKQLISALNLKKKDEIHKVMLKIIEHYTIKNSEELEELFWLQFFNSKDITKMLSLLEDKDKKVRKLTLLTLVIFLQNEDSKLYFVEKCGLLTKTGKIFLSRLKYLKLNLGDFEKSIKVLNSIMKKKEIKSETKYLFWYISLKFSSNEKNHEEKVKFQFFQKSKITYTNRDLNFTQLPDPIYNLCGIEIFTLKERSKKNLNSSKISSTSTKKKRKSRSIIKKPARSKSPMVRDLKSPSINRRANEFQKKNKTKMNKKFASKRKKSPVGRKSNFKKSGFTSIRTAKSSVRKGFLISEGF